MLKHAGIVFLALACAWFATTPALADDEAGAEKPQYVCPPCGSDCHDKTFETRGKCPVCRMTLMRKSSVKNVAIVLWEGVELLDFAGPAEVFAVTRSTNGAAFNVYSVATTTDPIVSLKFLTITPQYSIENCPKPDIVVVAGGGVNSARKDIKMIEWVKNAAAEADVAMSVCTGAFVLADAGLLDGREATTNGGAIVGLRLVAPNTIVHADRRVVDSDRVVTTGGISAGIDGALHVVARLMGKDVARRTADGINYHWESQSHNKQVRDASDRPRLTPGQKLHLEMLADGVAPVLQRYDERKAAGTADELPGELDLNLLGYAFLQVDRVEEALIIFEYLVASYPTSWNAHDSLGEGLLEAKRYAEADTSYRKSLELNPDNTNAIEMLKRIPDGG